MDAATLTSRIHAKADKELVEKTSEAFDQFGSALIGLGVYPVNVRFTVHKNCLMDLGTDDPKRETHVQMDLNRILECARRRVVEVAMDANRTKAVDAYMRRIEELSEQMQELQVDMQELQS